jgi:hypothetical protein
MNIDNVIYYWHEEFQQKGMKTYFLIQMNG